MACTGTRVIGCVVLVSTDKAESLGRVSTPKVCLAHVMQKFSNILDLTVLRLAFFYGIWIKQSSAMIVIFNLDKVVLKKLFPTMNI